MGFFSKLSRALSSKKYRINPHAGALTAEQVAAINIGAINAEQTSCFCNSLETGRDQNETKADLLHYYGIADHASAIEQLSWLRDRGHRIYFDAISGFCAGMAARIDDSSLTDSEKPDTYGYLKNLNSAISDLIDNGFLQRREDIARCSILAWDMGRLVLVARCCADLLYLSQEEAWQLIMQAHMMCKPVYPGWREFGAGYVIGRAMFGGAGVMLNGIMGITEHLLQDEESPWKNTHYKLLEDSV